jgi:hypothetical protein
LALEVADFSSDVILGLCLETIPGNANVKVKMGYVVGSKWCVEL